MSQSQGVFAIPETTEGKEALAREAVKVFRTMQPQLTAYARMLTGNPKMRVEVSSNSNGSTNGAKIMYRPPLELGLNEKHKRGQCGKRNKGLEMICKACGTREKVLVVIYHEIAHLCFGSFEDVRESDLVETTKEGVRMTEGSYAEAILKRIETAAPMYKNKYMSLAAIISDWLPIVLNAIEDARVDSKMFKARPGTKVMFDAKIRQIFEEGVETGDPANPLTMWNEQPLNNQAILGVFCVASKYDITGWFADKVVKDLQDPQLLKLISKVDRLSSVAGSYRLSFPILARLRALGYCVLPDDPETEEEPPPFENEEQEDDEQESSPGEDEGDDVGEGGSSGDDPSDGESGTGSDPGDGDSQPEDSSDSSEGEPSEGSESAGGSGSGKDGGKSGSGDESEKTDGADGSEGESSESTPEPTEPDGRGSGSATSPAEGSENDDPSGDSEERSGEADQTSGSDDELGSDSDDDPDESGSEANAGDRGEDHDGERGNGGGDDNSEEAGPEVRSDDASAGEADSSSEPPLEQDDSDESGTDEDENASSGDSSPGGGDPSDGADDASDDGSSGSGSDSPAGDSDADGTGDGSPESSDLDVNDSADAPHEGQADRGEEDSFDIPDSEEGEEAVDTGADEGKGGASIDAAAEEKLPYGTPAEGKAALLKFGDHEPPDITEDDISEQDLEDIEKAFDKAIIQGMYFETSSRGVSTVREHYWDKPIIGPNGDDLSTGWSHRSKTMRYTGYSGVESGIDGDFKPDEGNLQKSLLKLRRVFADNAIGGRDRHRTSGRVDRSALGKRAGLGDPRLFYTKHKVQKKSYFVVIGIDISGSTAGLNLMLAKKAALAQAMLLHRLGIPFAVYAHTANFADAYDYTAGFAMDIYHIKDPGEAWTEKISERLTSLGPCEGNLDGHSIEYYRKIAMAQQATDKIVMYYTDGQMPAANYDEELEVLQAQVRHAKRDGVTLMAVGIRTDSPIKHGLDTVSIEEDADNIKVITHLEKRLSNR